MYAIVCAANEQIDVAIDNENTGIRSRSMGSIGVASRLSRRKNSTPSTDSRLNRDTVDVTAPQVVNL